MSKLRVGIAGYGVVGRRRRHYIDAHPRMQTVAVCDQAFSGQSGPEGVLTFTDYRDLLKQELDAVFVCLPNYLAPEVTIASLQKGLHVFCEKPPGRTVADIERVIEAEKAHPGLKLKYGFNHRYHDSVREALRIVKSGELGEVLNVRALYGKSMIIPFEGGWRGERKLAGGGILLDQGIHIVDLIQLFCDEFVEVKSFVSNDFWKLDVEDNAYAILRDKKGRVAMVHSSATQWQHRFSLDIAFSTGYLELNGILSGSKSYGEETLVIGRRDEAHTGTMRYERIKYLEDNSWRDEVNEFAEAVVENQPVKSGTAAQALATMSLVYRIYTADEQWSAEFLR